MGNSSAGRWPYFSANFIMESWTMSKAASSSRTAKTACLKARRSTAIRKSDNSRSLARMNPLKIA
jgi:hypothetical protein